MWKDAIVLQWKNWWCDVKKCNLMWKENKTLEYMDARLLQCKCKDCTANRKKKGIRKIFWGTQKRSVGRRHQLKLSIRCGQERREPTSVTRKVNKENGARSCTGHARFLLPKGPLRSVLGSSQGARHLPSKTQTILAPPAAGNSDGSVLPSRPIEKTGSEPKRTTNT